MAGQPPPRRAQGYCSINLDKAASFIPSPPLSLLQFFLMSLFLSFIFSLSLTLSPSSFFFFSCFSFHFEHLLPSLPSYPPPSLLQSPSVRFLPSFPDSFLSFSLLVLFSLLTLLFPFFPVLSFLHFIHILLLSFIP